MGNIYCSCEERPDDGELFKLVHRAATHAMANFVDEKSRMRLTILFGGCSMISFANHKEDLYANYNEAESRGMGDRILELRKIIIPSENSGTISYYNEYLNVEAAYGEKSSKSWQWYSPCPEIMDAFMDEFEKVLATADGYCLVHHE